MTDKTCPVDLARMAKGLYWQEAWKLVEGCTAVSAGCDHCWSATETRIRASNPNPKIGGPKAGLVENGAFTGCTRLREDTLEKPLRARKPKVYAVWNDLFHESVPDDFIDRAFAVMALSPQHTFLVLTKRPERMRGFNWPLPNVYLGVSVEDQRTADERIPLLVRTPAYLRFVSYEPALGPVDFNKWFPPFTECSAFDSGCRRPENPVGCADLSKTPDWESCSPEWCVFGYRSLDWLIMGGESGPGARPMHPDWARSARDQCKSAGVPFFFKQWGEWAPGGADEKRSIILRADGRQETLTFICDIGAIPSDTREVMTRVGKRAAGCLLDGVEHKEVAG